MFHLFSSICCKSQYNIDHELPPVFDPSLAMPFSGLYFQLATLNDEITYAPRQRFGLSPADHKISKFFELSVSQLQ